MTIQTIYGDMDESQLRKRSGFTLYDEGLPSEEHVEFVEYYKDGELVHRSASVTLVGQINQSIQGEFNG